MFWEESSEDELNEVKIEEGLIDFSETESIKSAKKWSDLNLPENLI